MSACTLTLLYRNGHTSTWNMGSRRAAERLVDRLNKRGRITRYRIIEED
ncbi:hypothetical protein GCM10009804_03030 [Kribbella hippodromi]|uniref:Uncharacterized protein n=1 Tax=Kribbella hippodromi TaxID=434347 RepID=A0ABN2BYZ3_9ACTN